MYFCPYVTAFWFRVKNNIISFMMKRTWLLLGFLLSFSILSAQTPEEVDAYVKRYKQMAIQAQVEFGIPAAVTLAQGIHESGCGKSMLATEANNHFGIKCKSSWRGETILHDDDAKQECFRRYASAEDSYYDHSHFLKDQDRYHFLFDIELTNYKGWVSGLKRAGYATNPAYVTRLNDLIERYNLQQYTYEALNKTYATNSKEVVPEQDKKTFSGTSPSKPQPTASTPVAEPSPIPQPNNVPSVYYKGLKGFWAKKGQTLQDKAFEYNIRYPRLLLLNDLADAPLEHDQFIFIEKKRKVGPDEYHIVKEGEDMQIISQREAMMLDNLYQYNNLRPGQEPLTGERLYLQYKSYTTPKIHSIESTIIATNVERPVVVAPKEEVVKVEVKREPEVVIKQEAKVNKMEENLPPTPEPIRVELKVTPPTTTVENKQQASAPVVKQNPVVETRIQPTLVQETPKEEVKPTIVETKVLPKPIPVETRVQPMLIEEAPKPKPQTVIVDTIVKPSVVLNNQTTSVETTKVQQPVVVEIKEENKGVSSVTPSPITSSSSGKSPILDEEKARKVEALLAPEQKSEVQVLTEKEKAEKAEKERIEKELLQRKADNEAYAKSVTDRMEEERKRQEALQDEDLKKRRAMEEQERNRIDQEQKERDRIEAEAKAKLEAIELAKQQKIKEEEDRLVREKEANRIREEEARKLRRYDQPGTSDTIRDLKRKLDDIVYRTLPERKPLVKPAKDSIAVPTPPVKPVVSNNENGKGKSTTTPSAKKDSKPQGKNQNSVNQKDKLNKATTKDNKDKKSEGKAKNAKTDGKKETKSKNDKTSSKKDKHKEAVKTKDNKSNTSAKAKKVDPKKKK